MRFSILKIHPRYVLTAAHCAVGMENGESLLVTKLSNTPFRKKVSKISHVHFPEQPLN